MDGNEAAGRVAHRLSEVIAIYPITPASPMGELADQLSARGTPNLWGDVPTVIEMQSEGGAAGALHGALQGGALATTFTASQGLLLMLPDMYKVAGELTPAVIHVAARAVATHALSIFGDHSDVMAARGTGWAILHATDVQEAHDMALVAHTATLRCRVPFVHVMDGFRTSHELNEVDTVTDEVLAALVPAELVRAHRDRSLSPDRPVLRGTAQNPDTFFQSREAANPFHDAVGEVVAGVFEELAGLTGRHYAAVEYHGHPEATEVVVVTGSALWAARRAAELLGGSSVDGPGRRCGVLNVRLFRPFPCEDLVAALPATVRAIGVLDRCKEPGSAGEPLLLDVTAAVTAAWQDSRRPGRAPRITGGRYGLGSKELTPAMAASVFDELARPDGRTRFTVGITDDVTGLSLPVDPDRFDEPGDELRAVLVGLGSDGTVGAAKNAARVATDGPGDDDGRRHSQGYFVYDSKKSGAVTVSHLRFADHRLHSPWLVRHAHYVGIHQFSLLDRLDVLDLAAPGATVVINSPYGAAGTWDRLPAEVQDRILRSDLQVHVIDATALSREVGLGGIVSTAMLTCFVHLAGLCADPTQAAVAIEEAIAAEHGRFGEAVLRPNFAAVHRALELLEPMVVGTAITGAPRRVAVTEPGGHDSRIDTDVVQRVTARLLAGEGELLPVSAFPVDGTYPLGTSRLDKRGLAVELPAWEPELCIDCGKCAAICPHASVRIKAVDADLLDGAPEGFAHKEARFLEGRRLIVQVFGDDCTGCGLCVQVCPSRSKEQLRTKALNMVPRDEVAEDLRNGVEFFLALPEEPPADADPSTTRGIQLRQPLFEFSGACAGCGETPYLALLTRVTGDRMVVANATGCSSIYGGNLPTTPWSTDGAGRGPAWSNSLFEDNAEFGLGLRLALDHRRDTARRLLGELDLDPQLVTALRDADQSDEEGVAGQRRRVGELRAALAGRDDEGSRTLDCLADDLVDKVVWIVGGDGWAYDIGFGGLDHVLASGRDVNVLVMDTEGYSNTGGQASKSTFRSAVAKFASGGKHQRKKDLGMLAAAYGDVYVAQVAIGANDLQALRAIRDAQAHRGPSLVLAYSHCISHGFDLSRGAEVQKLAVRSGYWPLWRYDPGHAHRGDHPLRLDSRAPSVPFAEFARTQTRFSLLERTDPTGAAHLFALAQHDIDERWHLYEQMGELERWADDEVVP